MKKRALFKKAHAIFDDGEKAFLCLICEESGFEKYAYLPWKIPRHLKKPHKINRKEQVILGWNENFEKEYLKNRKKPMKYEPDDSIAIDDTPQRRIKQDIKRIEEERKTKRDSW
jgi:hypothetical protein